MELTKKQIQFIENRLENDGIKFWDIRIEMLDHVISDIEERLSYKNTEEDFRKMVQNSFVTLGWKENFNGSNFEKTCNDRLSIINKKHLLIYKKEIYSFFGNYQKMMFLFISMALYFVLSLYLSHRFFIIFSYTLFLIPSLIFFYESIRLWKKKIRKSYYKTVALNLIISSFLIFNVVMLGMKSEGQDFAISLKYQKPILYILLPLHLVLSYTGYKIYKKAILKVENIRKQMFL